MSKTKSKTQWVYEKTEELHCENGRCTLISAYAMHRLIKNGTEQIAHITETEEGLFQNDKSRD